MGVGAKRLPSESKGVQTLSQYPAGVFSERPCRCTSELEADRLPARPVLSGAGVQVSAAGFWVIIEGYVIHPCLLWHSHCRAVASSAQLLQNVCVCAPKY